MISKAPDSSDKIKISVITISFNQASYLKACVQSVLTQDLADCEYLIQDGGSTDDSRSILSSLPSNVKICIEKDDGPADALNRALRRAKGEYFVVINSDDLLLPHALKRFKDYLDESAGIDVIYGNGILFDDCKKTAQTVYSDRFRVDRYFLGLSQIFQQSSCISSRKAAEVGMFNVENRTFWDGELYAKIALAGGTFRRIPDTLGAFRIHSESISGSQKLSQRYASDRAALERQTGKKFKTPSTWARFLSRLSFDPATEARRLRQKTYHCVRPQSTRLKYQKIIQLIASNQDALEGAII
jgi:glycosyltransferase involved in cell wall biosynthesis